VTRSFELSHEFPFSVDRYIDLFFDRAFVEYLSESLDNMDEYRLEILERTPSTNLRTVRVAPRVELPRAVRTLLRGKRIAWLETTSHRVGGRTLEWTILTSVLTEKVRIGGTYVLEGLGAERCRRTVLGEIQVRAYGLAGTIEERIARQMEASYGSGRLRMIAYADQER
jgi:hypothetical protein